MSKESLGVAGVALAGLGAASVLWPAAPAWFVPAAMAGGACACVWGFYQDHYSELDKIFLNCQLYIRTINDTIILPRRIKTIQKDNGKDIILSLPQGLCLDGFKLKEQHISQALNKSVSFDYNNGILIMTIKDAILQKSYPFSKIHTDEPLGLVLGYSRDGIVTLPLDSSPSPHLGIFGETNSGKSVILRGIITQLILDKSPDEIELHLIDPKRVEFNIFKDSSFVKSFNREDDEILGCFRIICEITDKRYKLMEKTNTVNIKDYNKKAKDKFKYMLVIVDEFADLSENKAIMDCIHYLGRKARAVGVHLILATQRPDKDILDGKIKANIGNILGLKTSTQVNSRVIIDKDGLENLRGFGHGILKRGSQYTEIQSMMIEPDKAKKLIKHTFVDKDPEKKEKARGYVEIGN
jgi:DNA segregation ATPase FtsK/SpoIIIE, S-DNA-T family